MRTLILGLVLACGLSAQVVFRNEAGNVDGVNFCTGTTSPGGTAAVGSQALISSCTWTHTVDISAANRALFVAVVGAYENPTSVTMDGTPLTKLTGTTGVAWVTQIWGIANPSVGNHTMVVNWPIFTALFEGQYNFSIFAYGVDQATLVDAATSNATNTATVTTTVAGDMLIGVAAADGNTATTMTASTGQTEILSGSGGRNDSRSVVIGAIAYKSGATLGANTMTWGSTLRGVPLPGPPPPFPAQRAAGPTGIALVAVKAFTVAPTFTISPIVVPPNNSANIVVSLTGTATGWGSTTRFVLSGVSGAACVTGCTNSPIVADATHAQIVLTTGSSTGTLTVTESVTGAAVATVPVSSGGGSGSYPIM